MSTEETAFSPPDTSRPVAMRHEMMRKLIHVSTLGIPIGYHYTDQATALWVVGGLLAFSILVEYARMASATINGWFVHVVGKMLRENETGGTSGATFLLISSFLAILVFHKEIAVFCLLLLIVGDSAAGIIGRRYGQMRVFDKTVEGTLAFIIVGLLLAIWFPTIPPYVRLTGVIVAALIELAPSRVNDNLRIPVVAGSMMEILYLQFLKELPPILIEGGPLL